MVCALAPRWRGRYSVKKDSTSANSTRCAVLLIAAAGAPQMLFEPAAGQFQQLRRRLQIDLGADDVLCPRYADNDGNLAWISTPSLAQP